MVPFAHDRLKVLPPPPLTAAMLALLVVAQLGSTVVRSRDEPIVEETRRRLDDLWTRHPHAVRMPHVTATSTMTAAAIAAHVEAEPADEQARLQRAMFELDEQILRGINRRPEWRFGFVPSDPLTPLTLLAHTFVHLSWLHLLANLVLFWFVAGAVERRAGPVLFTAIVVAGVAGSAFTHAAFADVSIRGLPLVGASGVTMALAAALVASGPVEKVRWFVPPIFRWWTPAWALAALMVVAEVLHFALDTGAASFAHGGGAAVGVLAGLLVKRVRLK